MGRLGDFEEDDDDGEEDDGEHDDERGIVAGLSERDFSVLCGGGGCGGGLSGG